MKKQIALVMAGTALIGVTLLGASSVFAQNQSGQYANLVQMIAQKFSLNQTDVQAVFDSAKSAQMAKMQDKYNQTLDAAVKAGKITDAQKQLILAERTQLQNNRANWKTMTADQRKTAMAQQKTDLQNWAKQNNIDIKYLFGFGGRMGGGMRPGGR